jgi:iron complex outermembrane receptor protein
VTCCNLPPARLLALAAASSLAGPAAAQSLGETVVITGTRVADPAFDVPASVSRIEASTLREGRLQVNLSESVGGVPGLLARDRQNHAQDVQLSVRGFGARASFGIRGVRLYVDGIPATLPDGQGQISHADLGSAERIEVLRGPFSALYGNSSGGVLQVFTEEGQGRPMLHLGAAAGSDAVRRLSARLTGSEDGLGYVLHASRFETDGYREHSAARRNLGNAKLTWRTGEAGKLTVVANSAAVPNAQDPLGLTRAQFEADPRGADGAATSFDTRKNFNQTQLGTTYEHRLDARHALSLMLYGGSRHTQQFQAIPTGPQGSALHPGGVIQLARDYHGSDARWTLRDTAAALPYTLVAGLAYDRLDEHRRGFQNFSGSTLGVEGELRRDERNRITSVDPYLQATLQPSAAWRLDAGVRHSTIRVRSRDQYVAGANGDDSGATKFSATTPVLALMFKAGDTLHLYAAAGRGFETPTMNELAYRSDGSAGLNFALKPARSDNVELGAKLRVGPHAVDLALFDARTEDEIVTQRNSGGRASFGNAGRTRRHGAELSWSARLAGDWRAQAAFTWLEARYRDGFAVCSGTPCTTPNLGIPAGNRIPGLARGNAYAALNWMPEAGWRAGMETRWLSSVPVNDTNSDAAEGHAIVNASVGYLLRAGAWELNGFVRGDNLTGRRYAGSVIVNESNGRYFEPAPGRTWLGGVNASLRF